MARALAMKVRACALCRPLLIVFDGFVAYIDAFRKAFRSPLRTGRPGRPRLVAWPGIMLGRVIKHRKGRRLQEVERSLAQEPSSRVLPGPLSREAVQVQAQALLVESQGGGVLNTAYIERLNATFRSVIASLARRTRALARTSVLLERSMYLAGSVYNFCTEHRSLAVALIVIGRRGEQRRLVGRTPAMAAGLTDRCWSVRELLSY
jgi:IS1 family transposase